MVRVKISSQFQALRRLVDKTQKSMNIMYVQSVGKAVMRDASAPEM